MIKPLVPLGDFIERVGLRPAPDALHTYLQRLREHGFDVAATVSKVRGAGVALVAEVAAITRLEGGEDRDAIGKVRVLWVAVGSGDPKHVLEKMATHVLGLQE